jgi:hypothetical protein
MDQQPLRITVTRTSPGQSDEVIINLVAPQGSSDVQAARYLLREAALLASDTPYDEDAKYIYDSILPNFTRPGIWSGFSGRLETPAQIARFTAETIKFEVDHALRRAFGHSPYTLPYRENVHDLVRDAEAYLIGYEAQRDGAQVDGRWAAHLAREAAFQRGQASLAASRVAAMRKAARAAEPSLWAKAKAFVTNS